MRGEGGNCGIWSGAIPGREDGTPGRAIPPGDAGGTGRGAITPGSDPCP